MYDSIISTSTQNTKEKNNFLEIIQDNKKYLLNFKIKGDIMILILSEQDELVNLSFSKEMTLKDIKGIHEAFLGLNSFNEFYEYLKKLSELKKLLFIKKEDKLSINLKISYSSKEFSIEIILFPIQNNLKLIDLSKEIYLIKEKTKTLEKYNNDFLKKINYLENENNELKNEIKNL